MARSTFKVLFYLKRQSEQNGKAPIMGRITINGTISQFSCKMSVSPALWDTKANKAAGKSVVAQRINEKLENIKTNIGKHYQCICDRDSYVTAEKVKNAWLGFGDGYQLLIETFDAYLKDFEEKRVGKDRASGTLVNYRKARNYLAAFLRYEYKIEDIPFKELKREFIERYVVYLSTVRRMLPGSIHTPVKKLKLMTYTAFKNGWITTDPFSGFRISVTYRDHRFLSESELQAVMNVCLPNYKTSIVRDIFVFCCFTGLCYADVKKLSRENIHTDERGDMWISLFGCEMLGQLDCSGNLLENIDISACPYLTELICTDNLILSEISESFDRLTLFEHDIRYEYSVEKDAVTGQEKIVYTDRGKGWWYSGEPDKGYHGR